jgi:hypothetical protein
MKRIVFLLLAAATLVTACNNNKSEEKKVTIDPIVNAAQDMEKQKDELSKLTPVSMDQLKAMIPETFMGGKRTSHEVSSAMGVSVATGEYELNDSTRITLNMYDCAGPAGAGIYGLQYLGLLNGQEDNNEEYTKTIDFNGSKAFEHCDKDSNDCTITWFAGGRFLLTLEGDHVGADALKQAAKGLNIK